MTRAWLIPLLISIGCTSSDDTRLAVGATCSPLDTCEPNAFCDPLEAYCRCDAGSISCGSGCVRADSDPENCGMCGVRCGDGATCNGGVCSDARAALFSSSNASLVGGNVAASSCTNEFEAVASPVPVNGETVMFAAHGTNQVSAALGTWNNWNFNPVTHLAYNIAQAPGMFISGDAWTTFSTANNLVYVGMLGERGDGTECHAFASTSPTNLDTNTWTSPFACAVTANESRDQPSITFNNGSRDLYAAANDAANGKLAVDFYPNCMGQPGTAGCLRTATALLSVGTDSTGQSPLLRFGINPNPCTNHLAMAYWENSDVTLRFFTRTGVAAGMKTVIDPRQLWGTNVGCGNGVIRRCNQGTADCKDVNSPNDSCLRMSGRPSISVRFHNNQQCIAAIAYDVKESNNFFKSKLVLVDVTNESAPVVLKRYQSGTGTPWNDYLSVATTTTVNDNIGWFWQTDRDGACSVRLIASTDTNLGLVSMGGGQIVAGPYPAIHFAPTFGPSGMNDYNAATPGPFGKLYPTWGQPVPTTCAANTTPPCMQTPHWNLQAKISQVTP